MAVSWGELGEEPLSGPRQGKKTFENGCKHRRRSLTVIVGHLIFYQGLVQSPFPWYPLQPTCCQGALVEDQEDCRPWKEQWKRWGDNSKGKKSFFTTYLKDYLSLSTLSKFYRLTWIFLRLRTVLSFISQRTEKRADFILWQLSVCFLACTQFQSILSSRGLLQIFSRRSYLSFV